MIIREELSAIVSKAFAACGYEESYGTVGVSNRPDLCQYQCNGAMSAAKAHRLPPLQIAENVVAILEKNPLFSQVSAVKPGFINMNLSDGYLANCMNQMLSDERLLLPTMEKKTIVVDYGGPNIAKPLHVGHLRSAIIGDSLCNLARFLGHEIIGDVHLGDWGLQMGLVIAQIEQEQPGLSYFDPSCTGPYPDEAPVTADDLNAIYPAASARAKTDAAFAEKAAQTTVELQSGRPGYLALWKNIKNVSMQDLKQSYDILGVHFDKWYGESDADPYIPKVIEILKDQGLLVESDGAQIVDVSLPDDTAPMPPIIIVKSNGGDMYGTTDLGTILQRVSDWNPDEMWYVVDNRQALHFKQVFRCAQMAGILPQSTKCYHIGFGTMNGKDGKPYKTRDGGVMRLSDMIETVTKNAYERIAASDAVKEDVDKEQTAQIVGVAALKIGDMVNHRSKDYIFDMDRFLASEGKTGPYLQYTTVRINSVLERAGEEGGTILAPASKSERDIMLQMLSVSDALLKAYAEKAPSMLCESLFDIAGALNRFYGEHRILSCPDQQQRKSWLSLLHLTRRMMDILLSLLGIEIPSSM